MIMAGLLQHRLNNVHPIMPMSVCTVVYTREDKSLPRILGNTSSGGFLIFGSRQCENLGICLLKLELAIFVSVDDPDEFLTQ